MFVKVQGNSLPVGTQGAKNEPPSLPHTRPKINSKWVVHLNIYPQKLRMNKKAGNSICEPGRVTGFSVGHRNTTTFFQETWYVSLDLPKILLPLRVTLKTMKRQDTA